MQELYKNGKNVQKSHPNVTNRIIIKAFCDKKKIDLLIFSTTIKIL